MSICVFLASHSSLVPTVRAFVIEKPVFKHAHFTNSALNKPCANNLSICSQRLRHQCKYQMQFGSKNLADSIHQYAAVHVSCTTQSMLPLLVHILFIELDQFSVRAAPRHSYVLQVCENLVAALRLDKEKTFSTACHAHVNNTNTHAVCCYIGTHTKQKKVQCMSMLCNSADIQPFLLYQPSIQYPIIVR